MGSTPTPGTGSTTPSTTTTAATTTPATTPAGGTANTLPVALKVSFTLNTPDGLRQINFGLEKDTNGVLVNWIITFTLFERTDNTVAFGEPLVSLSVFVATELHPAAQKVSQHGLTAAQTAHATGPAANAAKKAHAHQLPMVAANKEVQNTLKS